MGRGLLIAVSGFSGAGKGTIMNKLMNDYPDDYALSISATTRRPRDGEIEGIHYFFKTKDEFEFLIKDDRLIEYAKYVDNYYGTPKEFVESQRQDGKDVFLEIEVQGALQVKEKFPDTVLLFVTTPSVSVLKQRLSERGTEDDETIRKRLDQAKVEAGYIKKYDYIVVNDELSKAVSDIRDIVNAEHKKTNINIPFIDSFIKDLGGEK